MTKSEIQGVSVYNGYAQYDFQFINNNWFMQPTFVDANGPGTPILNFTFPNPYILGHLVVPVYKPENRQKHYNVLDLQGNMTTPTYLSSTDLFNQVTYVPKGTAYDIFGGISQFDKIGFIVVPIGQEFYNWRTYFNAIANPDWNRSMIVYDENNLQSIVGDIESWNEFLSCSGAQRKPLYWKKQFKREFNKLKKIKSYNAHLKAGTTHLIFPLGRYNVMGPMGSAE